MYAPGDVRVEERDAPHIVEPTDAIIRVPAAFHLPLDQAADGYRAMDQREAIKVLLRP
ncbi:MAG: hypothetical protein QOJ21_1895 [Solirubrobacteraceae bacterium]|jgi:threonine dehydrogenase-like Zn-dependent dehydrogenase|nr:hypothetical protein [Solirubrobacteraceae bacterium]